MQKPEKIELQVGKFSKNRFVAPPAAQVTDISEILKIPKYLKCWYFIFHVFTARFFVFYTPFVVWVSRNVFAIKGRRPGHFEVPREC